MKRVVRALFQCATRSRLLARALFGGPLAQLVPGDRYFDVTTLALRRHLARRLPVGARVLEIGTGSFAILALWLERRRGCHVVATELDPATAQRARARLARAGAKLVLHEGAFLAGARGPFDLVVFNPPYVPRPVGEARGLDEAQRLQWDGGADGMEVVRGLCEALAQEAFEGVALLGVNSQYVSRSQLLALFDESPHVECSEHHRDPWLPVDLYDLVRRKSPSARQSSPVE